MAIERKGKLICDCGETFEWFAWALDKDACGYSYRIADGVREVHIKVKDGRLFASTICKGCGKGHVLVDEPILLTSPQ